MKFVCLDCFFHYMIANFFCVTVIYILVYYYHTVDNNIAITKFYDIGRNYEVERKMRIREIK